MQTSNVTASEGASAVASSSRVTLDHLREERLVGHERQVS